jgi:anti-anti-sigma factor
MSPDCSPAFIRFLRDVRYIVAMSTEAFVLECLSGERAGESILRCKGPLTIQTLFEFQNAVRGLNGAGALIIDFTGVPLIDSAGLGALVAAHISGRNSGRKLLLVGPNERVKALIRMTNLEQFFPTFASCSDAEAYLA